MAFPPENGVVGNIVKGGLRLDLQKSRKLARRRFQCDSFFCKEHDGQQHMLKEFWCFWFQPFVTFKNDVRIGPAEAEGIDADNQFSGWLERACFGHNLNVPVVERNVRIGRFDANGCRYRPMLDTVQRLYQSRHAGGRFEMSKIALYRADKQRAIGRAALA